jgi:hypothetical protein
MRLPARAHPLLTHRRANPPQSMSTILAPLKIRPMSVKDFSALPIEDAQPCRLERPCLIRRRDNCRRYARRLDLDFLQEHGRAGVPSADELNPERLQGRGQDALKFLNWLDLRKGSGNSHAGRPIRREHGIHRHATRRVKANALAGSACNGKRNATLILGSRFVFCRTFPSTRFGIRVEAEIADQRLGLRVDAHDSGAAAREPRQLGGPRLL